MNIIKSKRKISKAIFIGIIIELYILMTTVYLVTNKIDSFIAMSIIFILISLVVLLPRELKVFSILFMTLLYGGGLYLNDVIILSLEQIDIYKYVYLFCIPILGITTFFLVIRLEEFYLNMEEVRKKEALFTIDEVTGFENRGTLIKDLQRQMISAKRHKYPLSIMIVELQYANELRNLYNKEEINTIYLSIAKAINELARSEDLKYRYDDNLFMLIVPFTNKDGVEIIKHRFKENLGEINIISQEKGEGFLKFRYKIATKEYDESISESIDFIRQVEKELEYDV